MFQERDRPGLWQGLGASRGGGTSAKPTPTGLVVPLLPPSLQILLLPLPLPGPSGPAADGPAVLPRGPAVAAPVLFLTDTVLLLPPNAGPS